MQKIISVFKRDYEGTRQIYNEVVEGAEWVLAGEGRATVKIDGTCCMVDDGKLYKRYDAKHGKTPPPGFIPAQDPDPKTGHWPGWLLVGDGPADQGHREAWEWLQEMTKRIYKVATPFDGTYELVGPKIQGNPYNYPEHILIFHGDEWRTNVPRDFDGLRAYLAENEIEGIVFHHPDGRMAKVKRRDFGLPWPIKKGGVK